MLYTEVKVEEWLIKEGELWSKLTVLWGIPQSVCSGVCSSQLSGRSYCAHQNSGVCYGGDRWVTFVVVKTKLTGHYSKFFLWISFNDQYFLHCHFCFAVWVLVFLPTLYFLHQTGLFVTLTHVYFLRLWDHWSPVCLTEMLEWYRFHIALTVSCLFSTLSNLSLYFEIVLTFTNKIGHGERMILNNLSNWPSP